MCICVSSNLDSGKIVRLLGERIPERIRQGKGTGQSFRGSSHGGRAVLPTFHPQAMASAWEIRSVRAHQSLLLSPAWKLLSSSGRMPLREGTCPTEPNKERTAEQTAPTVNNTLLFFLRGSKERQPTWKWALKFSRTTEMDDRCEWWAIRMSRKSQDSSLNRERDKMKVPLSKGHEQEIASSSHENKRWRVTSFSSPY